MRGAMIPHSLLRTAAEACRLSLFSLIRVTVHSIRATSVSLVRPLFPVSGKHEQTLNTGQLSASIRPFTAVLCNERLYVNDREYSQQFHLSLTVACIPVLKSRRTFPMFFFRVAVVVVDYPRNALIS